jgi:hypothetical protein
METFIEYYVPLLDIVISLLKHGPLQILISVILKYTTYKTSIANVKEWTKQAKIPKRKHLILICDGTIKYSKL